MLLLIKPPEDAFYDMIPFFLYIVLYIELSWVCWLDI
jgi:hypothetical protein